jgi:hypothetical protein
MRTLPTILAVLLWVGGAGSSAAEESAAAGQAEALRHAGLDPATPLESRVGEVPAASSRCSPRTAPR